MKIVLDNVSIDGDNLEAFFRVVGEISKMGEGRYGHGSIKELIEREVSREVSMRIVKERSDEIVSQIDMESLIKRIQLNVVSNIIHPNSDRDWR